MRKLTALKIWMMSFLSAVALFPFTLKAQINAEQVLTIGRNVLSMDDYMLAIHYFNQAIKAKPYLSEPYFFRALAKLNLEDYKGAEADCTLAIERNKFKTEAYKLRGFARQYLGMDSLAIEDYNVGLSYNPTDKYFMFYKALAQTDIKDYEGATETFADLIRQYPKFDDAFTARAQLMVEKGDTVAALADIDKVLSMTKTQINPYLLKAEIEWKSKNWEEAGDALSSAIRLRPDNPDLYVNRAFVRYNSDDFFGAMSDYNYAIELDPDNYAAIFNRALLRYEVKDLNNAEKDFTRVLEIEPDNFHAIYNRGLIRLEKGNNREAYNDFQTIARKYPRFYPAYYAMAEAKQKSGDIRSAVLLVHEAEVIIEKYIKNPKKNPLDNPVISAAESNDRNRHKSSEEETDEEIMEKFNRLVTVSDVGESQLSYNEKIKGKVQDRDMKIENEPSYSLSLTEGPKSLRNLSNYFRELDDLNQSQLLKKKIYLVQGLSNVTDDNSTQDYFNYADQLKDIISKNKGRPADYLALGVTLTMLKDFENAEKYLTAALAIDNEFVPAYMARGFVRYRNSSVTPLDPDMNEEDVFLERTAHDSMLAEAMADFDMALRLNPRLIYAWFNKGNILYETGDYTSAMQCFSHAIEIDPEFGQAYFNRGLTYLQAGNRQKAFDDLSKAGELGILPSYNVIKRMK